MRSLGLSFMMTEMKASILQISVGNGHHLTYIEQSVSKKSLRQSQQFKYEEISERFEKELEIYNENEEQDYSTASSIKHVK